MLVSSAQVHTSHNVAQGLDRSDGPACQSQWVAVTKTPTLVNAMHNDPFFQPKVADNEVLLSPPTSVYTGYVFNVSPFFVTQGMSHP